MLIRGTEQDLHTLGQGQNVPGIEFDIAKVIGHLLISDEKLFNLLVDALANAVANSEVLANVVANSETLANAVAKKMLEEGESQ